MPTGMQLESSEEACCGDRRVGLLAVLGFGNAKIRACNVSTPGMEGTAAPTLGRALLASGQKRKE